MATWLVTGANRGLGLEMAKQLSERGDAVIATARHPEEATELAKLDVRLEALDVTDRESVRLLAHKLKDAAIDVLVNNSGIGVKSVPFEQLDLDGLGQFFQVNAVGPLRVTQALLDNVRKGERKVIAQVTSKMGSIADNTGGGAYAYRSSKAALNMANKSLAIDLTPDQITAVVLHPGWVKTDMGGQNAPLLPPESVAGMLKVIDGLTAADTGKFFDYAGAEVPW